MSGFKNYLAESENNVNEGLTDKQKAMITTVNIVVKQLKAKLKHLDVDTNGTDIVVGNDSMDNVPSLSVRVTLGGDVKISQSSHGNHNVKSLRQLSDMSRELADNYDFIVGKIKEAKLAVDTIMKNMD